MKRKILYLASMLLGLCACSEISEDKDVTEMGAEVSFIDGTSEKGGMTRAEFQPLESGLKICWEVEDTVGIFAAVMVEDNLQQALGNNYCYGVIPQEEGRRCVFSAGSSGAFRWSFGKAHTFYAYSPFRGTPGSGEVHAVPITLPASQVQPKADQVAHLNAMCVMKADPIHREVGKQEAVQLVFRNVFAIVKLEIKMQTGASDMILSGISLRAKEHDLSITEGTMDLATEEQQKTLQIQKGGREIALTFTEKPVLNSEQKTFYMMVAPGEHPASSLSFHLFSANGGVATLDIPEEVTFRPGSCHTRQITLTDKDFVFPEEVQQVTVHSGTTNPYTIVDLATASLYTDRAYPVMNLPEKYATWKAAICGIKTRQGGTLTVNAPGKIYMMTRNNRINVMTAAGWTAVTPTVKGSDTITENSNGYPLLIIWMKEVRAGETVNIPGGVKPSDIFGGFIPIAPALISESQMNER